MWSGDWKGENLLGAGCPPSERDQVSIMERPFCLPIFWVEPQASLLAFGKLAHGSSSGQPPLDYCRLSIPRSCFQSSCCSELSPLLKHFLKPSGWQGTSSRGRLWKCRKPAVRAGLGPPWLLFHLASNLFRILAFPGNQSCGSTIEQIGTSSRESTSMLPRTDADS